jgi:membrane protein
LRLLRRSFRISYDAFSRFLADDGWAIASHIALSTLMAMFPFLLVVTAIAAVIFGSQNLAEEAARILLTAWPKEVASPIGTEIHNVLSSATGDALTIGLALALFFASSGVESLRVGLNRSYGVTEQRAWWILRLESIAYVLVGAIALLAFAILVVFAPLIWAGVLRHLPELEPIGWMITFVRFAVAVVVLVAALVIVHLWLPAGRRRLSQVWPGIVTTLLMWLVGGALFGRYLAEFAFAYAVYYAGLASVMIVLVFLYLTAAIFIYGGELNTIIAQERGKKVKKTSYTAS